MSSAAEIRLARRVLRHELDAIKGKWAWILALGIVLIIVGTFAVAMPLVATLATALVLGCLLLMGGIAQLVGAFWTRDWSGFFLSLLIGVMYLVLGLMFLRAPLEGRAGYDPCLGLRADDWRTFPDHRIAHVPVSLLGLDTGRRRTKSRPWTPDLAAMARSGALGDRIVRGNRHDLHGLDLGDALARGEEPESSDRHDLDPMSMATA